MMENGITIGIWQVIILIVIVGVPVAKILSKAGFSKWFCVLAIIPFINIVFLWVFAYVSWPNQRESELPPSLPLGGTGGTNR